ncbi:MAG: hypothetical protein GY874_09625 [Desulfobacteraceae bacterium]|nr:hypothetical protein [Desulfobacteraceae bacterium]
MVKTVDPVQELINTILELPGDKIITLAGIDGILEIDIESNGKIGYTPEHEEYFKDKLAKMMLTGGGLTIRQFLSVKVQRKAPNGKMIWIPKKLLYGVRIINGTWQSISKTDMQVAHCMDCETGEPLKPEEDLIFSELKNR